MVAALGQVAPTPLSPTNIFAPASTPAQSIFDLSKLVLAITLVIFVIVGGLLTYAVVRFRKKKNDDGREPAQVYGSTQVELAWTITPVIIVLVLFLATARVLFGAHKYWAESRSPGLGGVTANDRHVPAGKAAFLTLLSADTDHSFWVPRLAGKTDLIPNHPNQMWLEPREAGVYLGQCAQYCGTQHAKMLLRVYVDSPADFDRWVQEQRQPAHIAETPSAGQRIFA